MWLSTVLQIILIYYKQPCVQAAAWIKGGPFNYSTTDFYFDRLVSLSLNISNWHDNGYDYVNAGQGVLISRERILTSYTPFRTLLHNKTAWELLLAATTFGRKRFSDGDYESYLYTHKIVCARQVQFLPDEKIEDRLWHGTDRRHSPLHDLMVLRILGNLTFSQTKEADYTPEKFPEGKETDIQPGIFVTHIATPGDTLGAYFKFASVGFTDAEHIRGFRIVRTVEYEPDDNALVDCDDWFPREWGYFICISNKENHPALGSGAMLVSDEKLFGVGSFALFRGHKGIMAFTDVRPYFEHIFRTCTYFDSAEPHPKNFPDLQIHKQKQEEPK